LKTSNSAQEHDNNTRKPNVAIIPHIFIEKASKFHLDELIALFSPLTNKVFVITGGQEFSASGVETIPVYYNSTEGVEIIPIKATARRSLLCKATEHVSYQLQILRALAKLREEIDVLVFFLAGIEYPMPLLFAKYLDIECFAILTNLGNEKRIRSLKESGDSRKFGELTRRRINTMLERITCRFSDKLIVYDESMVDQWKLQRFRKKIVITHRHFIDFDTFRPKNHVEQRDNIVTYVGRLHEDKGVLNLIKAIPVVLRERDDVKFVLIGDGHLEDEIRRYVDAHALRGSVTLVGWVPHEKLPDCYTKSKLLVLPSYNEGLPHVMLEAMACGTPVLATPVGAIGQVIKDRETGFINYDNSPACLAGDILDALTYPHLRRIAENARTLVESEYRYESVLERWKNVIGEGTEDDGSAQR
jgi:glycosyltransferase involved in cell wall biosynthesis